MQNIIQQDMDKTVSFTVPTAKVVRKGPPNTRWSPLKGEWVDVNGRIVKESSSLKLSKKFVVLFVLMNTTIGMFFVGNAAATKSVVETKSVERTVIVKDVYRVTPTTVLFIDKTSK